MSAPKYPVINATDKNGVVSRIGALDPMDAYRYVKMFLDEGYSEDQLTWENVDLTK